MFGGDPDKVTIAANVPILDFGGNMKKALMEFIIFFETTHSDVKKKYNLYSSKNRGVFRTLSDIWFGAFCEKN